ncbi:MAG: hypothetical protein IJH07_08730 [Ruminococcus sp.]|nr:hypothetical protein [Ruminococcus sp.]
MRVNKLSGIVMRITVILLCLVLFSSHLAAGMFAKYAASSENKGDARAARYGGVQVVPVDSEDNPGNPMSCDVNGGVSYRFKVDNSSSEVPVKYNLRISFAKAAENFYSGVKLNDTELSAPAVSDDAIIYSYESVDPLKPGIVSDEFVLTFNVDTPSIWTETMDDTLPDNSIQIAERNKYPISIFVDAVQID